MENTTESTLPALDKTGVFAISEQFHNSFKKVNNIITPIICTLGILGNCAGLVIFIRDTGKRKMIIYYYLIALFIFDSIYMSMGIFFLFLELTEYLELVDNNYISTVCLSYRPYLDMALNHVSSALLIVMSLERMVALMFPFKVNRFILTRFPKTIILALVIFSFGYTFPFLIVFTIQSITTPFNTTIYFQSVKPEYLQLLDKTSLIETLILHYVAPILVLVVNVIIIVCYARHLNQKEHILRPSSGNNSQIKVTTIIVAVSFLYIILSIPNMFIQTLMLVDKDYQFNGRFRLTFRFFVEAGDMLANINAASDFLIYVLVSSRYRRVITSCFCRCARRKNSNDELNVFSKDTCNTTVNVASKYVSTLKDQ